MCERNSSLRRAIRWPGEMTNVSSSEARVGGEREMCERNFSLRRAIRWPGEIYGRLTAEERMKDYL